MERGQICNICHNAISANCSEIHEKGGSTSSASPPETYLEEFYHLFLQDEAFKINLTSGFGTNCCKGCSDILSSVLNGMNKMEGLQMEVFKIENTLLQKLKKLKGTGEKVKLGIEHLQKSNARNESSLEINQIYLWKAIVKASTAIKGELAELQRKLNCLKTFAGKGTSSSAGQIVSTVDTNFSDIFEESEAFRVKTENNEDTEAVPVLESAVKVEREEVRKTRSRTLYRKESVPLPVEFVPTLQPTRNTVTEEIDLEAEETSENVREELEEPLGKVSRVVDCEPQNEFSKEVYQSMCNYCWDNAPLNNSFLLEPRSWKNFTNKVEKLDDVERVGDFLVWGNRAVYRKCIKYVKLGHPAKEKSLRKNPNPDIWTQEFATSAIGGAIDIRKFLRKTEVISISAMLTRLTKKGRIITPGSLRAHAWVEVISKDFTTGRYSMTIKDGTTLAPMDRIPDLKIKKELGIQNSTLIGPNNVDKLHNNCFASALVAIVNHLMGYPLQ